MSHGCVGDPCVICFPHDRYVFPQDETNHHIPDKFQRHGGLELRDYFAAKALTLVNVAEDNLALAAQLAAKHAYAIADAMLVERSKSKGAGRQAA